MANNRNSAAAKVEACAGHTLSSSAIFGYGRKKKAKGVKQPKWREYFYGNVPVHWNQALHCKFLLASFSSIAKKRN